MQEKRKEKREKRKEKRQPYLGLYNAQTDNR